MTQTITRHTLLQGEPATRSAATQAKQSTGASSHAVTDLPLSLMLSSQQQSEECPIPDRYH